MTRIATERRIPGIIPFGSDHASIIGQASMFTAQSVTDFGAGSLVEAGAIIDPVLGIKAGTTGAVMFLGHQFSSLGSQGQFSFDVETNAIAETNTATASVGPEVANNTYLVTHSDTGASGLYGRTWIDATNRVNFEAHTGDVHASIDSHSLGNGESTRVTYSWTYDTLSVYFNGRLHGSSSRTNHVTDIFKYIYLGSNRGAASAGSLLTLQNHYIRNFVLASQPVELRQHGGLLNVYMFGDSFVSQAALAGAVGYYRNNAQDVVEGYFAKRGININLSIDGHSGATISDSGGVNLESFRAALLSNSPDVVIFQAGPNDAVVGSGVPPDFTTSLDDHMMSILDGTAAFVILGNSPSAKYDAAFDTDQYVAQTAEVNNIIAGTQARISAVSSAYDSRILLYDLFTDFGGETPIADVFAGQVGDVRDNDRHPSAKGQLLMGEAQAEILLAGINL